MGSAGRLAAIIMAVIAFGGCFGPASPPSSAPPRDDGVTEIRGSIVDEAGDPVPYAAVRLFRADGKYYPAEADGVGHFQVAIAPERFCVFEVAKPGFHTSRFEADCSKDLSIILRLPRQPVDVPPAGAAPPTRSTPALSPAGPQPPTLQFEVEANRLHARFQWERTASRIEWDFGDGTKSDQPDPVHFYYALGTYVITLTVWDRDESIKVEGSLTVLVIPHVPHVVVGIPDSGVNVYHQVYRRPGMTSHPCTYVRDYPCDVPALELTFDAPTWQAAFEADRAKWAAIKPGEKFWIPGTNIIGAVCSQPYQGSTVGSTDPTAPVDYCIIDDSEMHGTGTSSSVLSENPDALLVVVEGNSGGSSYLESGFFPIDVISFSWGAPAPLVGVGLVADESKAPFFVAASGNEGAFPVALDGTKAHTTIITVGGADAGSRSEPGYSSWKTADFVSEYCRPTAQTRSFTDMRPQYCGTSFAAPTFAGALSRVILELRQRSGYTGSVKDGMADPILGVTKWDIREALNHTATYTPKDAFNDGGDVAPLVAPWYQWGWGYVARNEVPGVLACLLEDACPERPAETVAYMEAVWEVRKSQSGEALPT